MDKPTNQTETLLFGEVPIVNDLNSESNISDSGSQTSLTKSYEKFENDKNNSKDIVVKIAENSVNSKDSVISEKFEEIIENEKNELNGHQNGFKTDNLSTVIDITGGESFFIEI